MSKTRERVAETRSVDRSGSFTTATIPQRLVEKLELDHQDQILWDWEEGDEEIRVVPLD